MVRTGAHAEMAAGRLRTCAHAAIACALAAGCASAPANPQADAGPAPRTVAYANARCFDGAAFAPCTLYAAGEVFVEPVASPDSVVDLGGAFVVAPFGEAHNHNVEPGAGLEKVLSGYREAGVLYVQNLNSLPGTRDSVAARRAPFPAPEVSYAHGGLTSPGGHPSQIAAANIARGRWSAADGDGAFYHAVDDSAGVDAAWQRLRATQPDLVKLYLLYSDRYGERQRDSAAVGWRGIDPALAPRIVRLAHAAGLRVAAHIETAADFRTAVAAGVDIIAHMPGFRGDERTALPDLTPYQLTAGDAREAAQRRAIVVTTLAALARYADAEADTALRTATERLHRANLALLAEAGARIVIGSDEYGDTSLDEARYLATLGVFSRAEVLRIWSEATPQAIFPGRRIGRLAPAYEASFVALAADPTVDFEAVARVTQVVHRGRVVATPGH